MKRRKGDLARGCLLAKRGEAVSGLKGLKNVRTEAIEDAAIPLRKFFPPSMIGKGESCLPIDR